VSRRPPSTDNDRRGAVSYWRQRRRRWAEKTPTTSLREISSGDEEAVCHNVAQLSTAPAVVHFRSGFRRCLSSVARSALKHGPSHHPLATHAGGDARLQSTSKRHAVAVGWTPTNWDTVVGANCQVGAQSPTFVTACCIHGMHCSLSDECHLSYDNPRVSDIKPTYLHIPVFAFAQVFPCRGLCLLRLL